MSRRCPDLPYEPVKNDEQAQKRGKAKASELPLRPEDQEGVLWKELRSE